MLADELANAKLRADAQALDRDLRSVNRSLAKSSSEPLAASSSSKTSRPSASMEDHQLRNIVDSIPTFSGDPNQNVRDWIEIISLKFDIIDYDPLQRRRFLPQYLYGAALKWHLANRDTLPDLGPYLRALELAFPQVTTTSRDMNLQLLKNRVQGPSEPFHLYYNAVVDLCRQHNPEMADVQIVDWLKAGMRLELFEKLHGDEFLTPQSLLLRTQRLELDHEVVTTRLRLSLVPTASSTPRSSSGRVLFLRLSRPPTHLRTPPLPLVPIQPHSWMALQLLIFLLHNIRIRSITIPPLHLKPSLLLIDRAPLLPPAVVSQSFAILAASPVTFHLAAHIAQKSKGVP